MWVFDFQKVVVIPLQDPVDGLLFLVDGDTLAENAFNFQVLRLALEVEQQHLEDGGHPNLTHLIISQVVYLLSRLHYHRLYALCEWAQFLVLGRIFLAVRRLQGHRVHLREIRKLLRIEHFGNEVHKDIQTDH